LDKALITYSRAAGHSSRTTKTLLILALISSYAMSSAKPLKFSTPGKSNVDADRDKTPGPSKLSRKASVGKGTNTTPDISSPHELTAFVRPYFKPLIFLLTSGIQVENLLEQLDKKFDDMSEQILDRSPLFTLLFFEPIRDLFPLVVSQMSTRVDALEASIQDIINGDVTGSVPPSPAPGTPGVRRSGSALV
jgi:heat shock factor-binding protein 1